MMAQAKGERVVGTTHHIPLLDLTHCLMWACLKAPMWLRAHCRYITRERLRACAYLLRRVPEERT